MHKCKAKNTGLQNSINQEKMVCTRERSSNPPEPEVTVGSTSIHLPPISKFQRRKRVVIYTSSQLSLWVEWPGKDLRTMEIRTERFDYFIIPWFHLVIL